MRLANLRRQAAWDMTCSWSRSAILAIHSSRRAEAPGPATLTNRPSGTVAMPGPMRRSTVSTNSPRRRDAPSLPPVWSHGDTPLDQPAGDGGEIQDPMMICPICEEEFRATGMTWLGSLR